MKNFSLHYVLWLLCLLSPMALSAQDLSVRSLEQAPDATASMFEYQLKDNNGDFAGIVKVHIAVEGVKFDGGGVLKQQKMDMGEYWVWMAKDSSRLTVRAPGFLPLEVNFRNYEGVNIVHSKTTYKLVLTVPTAGGQPQDDGMTFLVVKTEPSNAMVVIDGSLRKQALDGEAAFLLPRGNHNYEVSANDYALQSGTVTLGKEKKTLTVKLVSTKAQLRVECPTSGAQVYVDDQLKGTVPWSGSLGAEAHRVEIRLNGYHSQSQIVTLSENANRTLTFPALKPLSGSLIISYSPSNSDVFIDGKKVGTTPDIFRGISVGSHQVEIRKEGYTAKSLSATVRVDETTELSGKLDAIEVPNDTPQKDIAEVVDTDATEVEQYADEPVVIDGIEYSTEFPSDEHIKEWAKKNSGICRNLVNKNDTVTIGMSMGDYSSNRIQIPRLMLEEHPCLVYLILKAKSLDSRKEKQSWFDLYSLMDEERINKLYNILYREQYRLEVIHISYLGDDYYFGENGKSIDYAEAAKWYRKGAAKGNAHAQCNLGEMYRKGQGVSQDYLEAVKWSRKSADQGNATAQANLGEMYRDGLGVVQDYSEALKWFKKSADQGKAQGQTNLGMMYENGYGVVKDKSQAIEWYEKAAAQGYEDAKNALKRLNGN